MTAVVKTRGMTIFKEIKNKNEQKKNRTTGGRTIDEKHWLSEGNNDAQKRNKKTESGELRELRRDREKKKLSRDRRPNSRFWDF